LLAKYAIGAGDQQLVLATIANVLELAATTRARAAARVGTACFPGC
jgi:hypothetical protein